MAQIIFHLIVLDCGALGSWATFSASAAETTERRSRLAILTIAIDITLEMVDYCRSKSRFIRPWRERDCDRWAFSHWPEFSTWLPLDEQENSRRWLCNWRGIAWL